MVMILKNWPSLVQLELVFLKSPNEEKERSVDTKKPDLRSQERTLSDQRRKRHSRKGKETRKRKECEIRDSEARKWNIAASSSWT